MEEIQHYKRKNQDLKNHPAVSETFSRETLLQIAGAQRRLLALRRRFGLPIDARSVENLRRIEAAA